MELTLDPEMVKKRKSGSVAVASAALTDMSPNQPNVDDKMELPNAESHSFAAFDMRGFGKFDHSLGVGVYTNQHEDASIRTSDSRRELMMSRGWLPRLLIGWPVGRPN